MNRISAIRRGITIASLGSVLALVSVSASSGSPPAEPNSGNQLQSSGSVPQSPFPGTARAACGPAQPGHARCFAELLQPSGPQAPVSVGPRTRSALGPATRTGYTPPGLSPSAIAAVYGFSATATDGAGTTVAVVDAFDDPTAATELSTFSQQFGLPPCASSPCFTKVNQNGGTNYPRRDYTGGWSLEIAIDIEWVHAIAPGAHVLLVEATTDDLSNLFAAEQYAADHADYVANSWGSSEFGGETVFDTSLIPSPGHQVSYFFATGDQAGAVDYPAVSPNVIAVGGTSLKFANGLLSSETAWSRGGGGCSVFESADPAQAGFSQYGQSDCGGFRAVPDVSLDADPNSGVSVYRGTGWAVAGGTSTSTPMWAAEAAVLGAPVTQQSIYSLDLPFRDITAGSNGHPALTGFDLATGLGSLSFTPGAPSALVASAGGGVVTLSWTAPTGAPTTSYIISRGVGAGAGSPIATDVTDTSYTDTAIRTGTTYFYKVQAVNSLGTGPFSNVVSSAVGASLVASFTQTCHGVVCTFVSTSKDTRSSITSYTWSGGSSLRGSNATVSHTYSRAGLYAVQLRVTDGLGATSTAASTVTCAIVSRTLTCS
jgi:hypothetical protein